ncbi:RES family NAD+ phosphorylase [Edaphobacter bradus]|uniref:RES family NAD+ phosphorylase n=1 Tax=Edaphobacter bradus TaxID=2259016 RepID=UPI0021E05103|nr:RES family NAD+ phosphorylase [Edaphobacter bradus]
MNLWRISKFNSLTGEGGLHYSARWHTAGRRIVYLAESPAGALIEALVHMELNQITWPRFYDLMQIAVPDDTKMETIEATGKNWKELPELTQELGDNWLRSMRTALARVPSAIMPDTWNVLLNPEHPSAAQIKIVRTTRADFDSRLFQRLV